MKKRILSILMILALSAALLLSACGEAGSATEAAETDPGTAETAPETAETAPGTAETAPETAEEPTAEPDELTPSEAEPWEADAPAITAPEGAVTVDSVDAFLAALAPHTTLVLAPGAYDLSTAADYGEPYPAGNYRWEEVYDGFQLVLEGLDGLQILAPEGAELQAVPRYANVLSLRSCRDLAIAGLTLGHTREQGICSGGVVQLLDCEGVALESCRLYGCGTIGLDAYSCKGISASFCEIYECSFGAVQAENCQQIRMDDCWVHDCGKSDIGPGYQLFRLCACRGFGLVNTRVTDNLCQVIFQNERSQGVEILGCPVEGNRVKSSVFQLYTYPVLVEDCCFTAKGSQKFYDLGDKGIFAQDRNGEDLISFDLERMQRQRASYAGYTPTPTPAPTLNETIREDGTREVRASTVDELLAAIAPNTTVLLAEGDYDLSSAADYGGLGGEWYTWESVFDGYGLVIQGVENFRLQGAGRGITRLLAVPRYANVLHFVSCEGIELADLTAGHTEGGECGGNVVELRDCTDVSVRDCGFFGCGMVGLTAGDCRKLRVENTELYSCTSNGADFYSCTDVELTNCSIYGCRDGRNLIYVFSSQVRFDGQKLEEGVHLFDHHSYLGLRTDY